MGTILVADGDRALRTSLAEAIRRIGYSVREVATGQDALASVRRAPPALVILDVSLPGVSGYEVCRELREEFGEGLPIIFISAERTEPLDRVGGLLLGADDYVVKPFDMGELVARVRRSVMRTPAADGASNGAYELTKREFEVLRLLAAGRQTSEIARDLVISTKTVGAHIQRVLAKLGVHTQAQAVGKAYREQIIRHDGSAPAARR